MDRCRNNCLCRDVGEMVVKTLLHLGVVEFLVKGMVSFVPDKVVTDRHPQRVVTGISYCKFQIYGSSVRSWATMLGMIYSFDGEILQHPDKVNVFVDGDIYSRKPTIELLQELYQRMISFTPLLKLMEKVQGVLFLDENAKCKRV